MTTSIATLPAFLLARIAEDEEEARICREHNLNEGSWMGYDEDGDVVIGFGVTIDMPVTMADHIARHDPARTLAECQAKRALIALHTGMHECPWCDDPDHEPLEPFFDPDDDRGPEFRWCPVLRLLAVVYAEHPEYRNEWAP